MSLPTPQGVSSPTFKPPPLDGSLTVPELFDYNGFHSAKHTLFRYDSPDNGEFRSITWEDGVAAFHVAGRYFREHINDETPVVVGILANAGTPLFPCKGSQRLVPSRYDHVFYRACWPNAPWQDPLSHFAS